MAKAEKIAITLPKEILNALERHRAETGESRSALVSLAIERLLRERQEERLVRRYVEGYHRRPESEEEVLAAQAAAADLLTAEPWE